MDMLDDLEQLQQKYNELVETCIKLMIPPRYLQSKFNIVEKVLIKQGHKNKFKHPNGSYKI